MSVAFSSRGTELRPRNGVLKKTPVDSAERSRVFLVCSRFLLLMPGIKSVEAIERFSIARTAEVLNG
jgi:hypothetical protein